MSMSIALLILFLVFIMVSPTTKKKMLVPPKLVLSFKPATSVKEKLKGGGE